MQIVIDIPNSLYANLSKIQRGSIASKRILDCVRNGEVLPKHGRLVDRNEVGEKMQYYGFYAVDMTLHEFIEDELTTVLEATEEQE